MYRITALSTPQTATGTPTTLSTPQATGEVRESGPEVHLETALEAATGLEVIEVGLDGSVVSISYEQATDDGQAVLVQRWLDLAMIALSFMEQPQTIMITSVTEGTAVSEIIIEAGDLASLLMGERSLQETLSKIKVEDLR